MPVELDTSAVSVVLDYDPQGHLDTSAVSVVLKPFSHIFLGTKRIDDIYLGGTNLLIAKLGSEQVY